MLTILIHCNWLVVLAALLKGTSLLRFNSAMQTFELIQYIDSQPCSCIAFSNTQIIIGWHKFYQIDLQYSIDYN